MCENQRLINEFTDFHMVTPVKDAGCENIASTSRTKVKNLDFVESNEDASERNFECTRNECTETIRSENDSGYEKSFRKRLRDSSSSSLADSDKNSSWSPKRKKHYELETDSKILARRQKQISYGKNTIGYDRYIQLVPKKARKKHHPKTPPMHYKYSRRAWDGLIKVWRQHLHFWDEPNQGNDSETIAHTEREQPLLLTEASDSTDKSVDDSLFPKGDVPGFS